VENMVKCTLSLTGDAFNVLAKQASPRKRGEFVSRLLLQYSVADSGVDQADIEGMRLGLLGLAGANKTLEGRVMKLERQVAAILAGQK
jgi:hypothetical protein